MIENLVTQFMGSGAFGQAVEALKGQHHLNDLQARGAVQATAEGTVAALKAGEGGGIGGFIGKIGGLLGGSGMPPQLDDHVVSFVAGKTGLDPAMAKNVVNAVLPKVIEFAKGMTGGKSIF